MAGREPSISRRRVLGAAASLPLAAMAGDLSPAAAASDADLDCFAALATTWEERLARYRVLAERARRAAESGWFRAANDRYNREHGEIAARFGSWKAAGECEEGRRLRRAAFARIDRAEDAYWRRCTDPMQKAAVALALTPAPDIPAVRAKIAVMRAHELDELECMQRHPLDVVDEDLGRLA